MRASIPVLFVASVTLAATLALTACRGGAADDGPPPLPGTAIPTGAVGAVGVPVPPVTTVLPPPEGDVPQHKAAPEPSIPDPFLPPKLPPPGPPPKPPPPKKPKGTQI